MKPGVVLRAVTAAFVLALSQALPAGAQVRDGVQGDTVATPATAPAPLSSLPATGRYLQNFAPTYMTPKTRYTMAQAVQIAKTYDLIAAHRGQFDSYLAAMKAANPKLVVLIYFNGSLAQKHQGTTYPASWYAHDQSGHQITSRLFGNYLMDVGNSGWAGTVAHECATAVAAAPFDGCFIDMLGDAVLFRSFLSGVPINPATGHPWTTKERMDATTAIAQGVRSALPAGKIVMANGLDAGFRYYDPVAPSSELLAGADAGLAEIWLRQATRPVTQFRTTAQWLQDVQMMGAATALGRAMAVTTKVWIGATAAEVKRWHAYSLASFLLGTMGTSYYAFLSPNTPSAFTANNPWDHLRVGAPLGSMTLTGGVYERSYTHALALVNPGSTTQTVAVTKCTTLEGKAVTSITLAPDTGEVCTH